MRVVIVSDFAMANGGAAKVAIDSACALAELGIDILFLYGTGAHDPTLDHGKIELVGLDLDDVWSLPKPQAARQGIWNAEAARRFETALRDRMHGPAVVHFHQWTKVFSPSVFAVARKLRLPTIVTLHAFFAVCPNGVYYRFDQHEPCRLKPMSLACMSTNCDTRSYVHKLIRVARQAGSDHILDRLPFEAVHVSDGALAFASRHLSNGVGHHRVDNPIAVSKDSPAMVPSDGKLYYVGRFTREKGVDLVAVAARMAGMRCAFVGEGPMVDEIKELNPDAEILSWLPHRQVLDLLRLEGLAVIAPSRWLETGPLTIAEARAAGLPVVVSLRAGASEKVENGIDGLIVEPEVQALASALARLRSDDTAKRLGAAAYERFWSRPQTPQQHASRLTQVYQTALARRRAASL